MVGSSSLESTASHFGQRKTRSDQGKSVTGKWDMPVAHPAQMMGLAGYEGKTVGATGRGKLEPLSRVETPQPSRYRGYNHHLKFGV